MRTYAQTIGIVLFILASLALVVGLAWLLEIGAAALRRRVMPERWTREGEHTHAPQNRGVAEPRPDD